MSGHKKRRLSKTRAILKAAEELFSVQGIEEVSMDDIARRAGVARMTIFNYFGTKDGLVYEMMRSELDQGCEEAEKVLSEDTGFEEKLEAIIDLKERAIKRFGKALVIDAFTRSTKLMSYRVDHLGPRIDAIVRHFFSQGKAAGAISSELPDSVLMAYFRVFSAGLSAEGSALAADLEDPDIRSKLIRMYFAGLTSAADRQAV